MASERQGSPKTLIGSAAVPNKIVDVIMIGETSHREVTAASSFDMIGL
jgi:hypothetical protein